MQKVRVTNMFLNLEINSTIDWGKSYDQNTLSCLENPTEGILVRPAEYYRLINSEKLIEICS